MPTAAAFARRVRERLLDGAANQNLIEEIDTSREIDAILHDDALEGVFHPEEAELRQSIASELSGFGVLEPFLLDPSVEEIWINRPNEIFSARDGEVSRAVVDLDSEALRTLVLRMLRNTGRRIDTSLPFADAALPDGSRLHVVIPDVTAAHWAVNIRKFPKRILQLEDLVTSKMLTKAQSGLLERQVRAGANVLISGATHTGKTTLLSALLGKLPEPTRLISCEETFELRSNLKDWVAMQARQPNLEGRGEIPLRRLVKEALRMRPDRLVIGEVREAEALDLLIAMNSGVYGACTIHANSAKAAINKLCTLPLLAGPNISPLFVERTVADSVNLVVHCEYLASGQRKVAQICKVVQGADGRPSVVDF